MINGLNIFIVYTYFCLYHNLINPFMYQKVENSLVVEHIGLNILGGVSEEIYNILSSVESGYGYGYGMVSWGQNLLSL